MNTHDIGIISIIFISFFVSTDAWAQNSITSQHGGLNTDQAVYSLERNESTIVKITGIGQDTQMRERVSITITLPDLTTSNHSIFSTDKGYFELLFPIFHTDVGDYKIFASMSGKIIGEIYFTVEEEIIENSSPSLPKTSILPKISHPNISSLITIKTDSSSYKQGDTIHISGIVPNYSQSNLENQMQVSLQIINPKNNIVAISQISPSMDNTYSTSVEGIGPLWKSEGEYTVRSNYFQQNAFTTFEFLIPISSSSNIVQSNTITEPIPKSTTKLSLNQIPNSFEVSTLDSKTNIMFSGKLQLEDGTPVSNEEVYVLDTNGNFKLKIYTNDKGEFSRTWKNFKIDHHYKIHATYYGSEHTTSSKSQTEYFSIKLKTTISPPTTSSNLAPQIPSFSYDNSQVFPLIILGMIVVSIIVVIKRRKNNEIGSTDEEYIQSVADTFTNTVTDTVTDTFMEYFECPNCHNENIEHHTDGSTRCPKCKFCSK